MTRKRKNKPIMIPEASVPMQQMRHEIAKKMGYISIDDEHWWQRLMPMQQSEVNGVVTKLMVEKARRDMMQGIFPR